MPQPSRVESDAATLGVVVAVTLVVAVFPGFFATPPPITLLGAGEAFSVHGAWSVFVFNATGNVTIQIRGAWSSSAVVSFWVGFSGETWYCPGLPAPGGCPPPDSSTAKSETMNLTLMLCRGSPQCGGGDSVDPLFWLLHHFVTVFLSWTVPSNGTAVVSITAPVTESYATY
jgi:hypothetical protein